MRIYIAGPMTGLPEWNYPAFHQAADAWRKAGWDVVNPAEAFDGDTTRAYKDYVEADIAVLRTCDAIAMLPGWDAGHSGAIWEREVAKTLLGLRVYDAARPVGHPSMVAPSIGEWIDQVIPLKRGGPDNTLGRWTQDSLENSYER